MRLAAVFACVLGVTAAQPVFGLETSQLCDAAASRVESRLDLPSGILAAVGTVESGSNRSAAGPTPWPWTIDVAGRGYFYESKAEAIDAVLRFMRLGIPKIDIGCFQVDVWYHSGVFSSLDDAFDPDRNAEQAALILLETKKRGSDWATAVAQYHSAVPELGLPYLLQVRAALPRARQRAATAYLSGLLEQLPASQAGLPTVVYGIPSQAEAYPLRPPVANNREQKRYDRELLLRSSHNERRSVEAALP